MLIAFTMVGGVPLDAPTEVLCMGAVLNGLRVLDLSYGITGPTAAMLMADHGAHVTRIEAPGGGPPADLPGRRVWNRGKRSAVPRSATSPSPAPPRPS